MDVEARRDFWATMRTLRRRRQDRHLRDALPRRGRRLRRPDHPDGARPGRRRRTGHRDQGDGRRCGPSARRCPAPTWPRSAALPGVDERRAPAARRSSSTARLRRRRCARCCRPSRRPATSRSPAPAWKRPSCNSPATTPTNRGDHAGDHAMSTTLTYFEMLRLRAQQAVLHLLAGLPARPVLPARRAEQGQPRLRWHARQHTGCSRPVLHGRHGRFGAMIAVMSGGARIAAERTVGWNRQLRLTPLSARTYFARQGAHRLPWPSVSIVLLYVAGIALGVRLAGQPLGRDDRADPGRARPVRRARHRGSVTCSPSTRWARRSVAVRRCSPSSAAPGSRSPDSGACS